MDSKRRTPTEWLDPKEQPKHRSKERFTSTGDGLGEIRRIPKDTAGLSREVYLDGLRTRETKGYSTREGEDEDLDRLILPAMVT
jgi:hypothetical protein